MSEQLGKLGWGRSWVSFDSWGGGCGGFGLIQIYFFNFLSLCNLWLLIGKNNNNIIIIILWGGGSDVEILLCGAHLGATNDVTVDEVWVRCYPCWRMVASSLRASEILLCKLGVVQSYDEYWFDLDQIWTSNSSSSSCSSRWGRVRVLDWHRCVPQKDCV